MPSLSSLPVTCLTVAAQTTTTSWKISSCKSDVDSKWLVYSIKSDGHRTSVRTVYVTFLSVLIPLMPVIFIMHC